MDPFHSTIDTEAQLEMVFYCASSLIRQGCWTEDFILGIPLLKTTTNDVFSVLYLR